MLYTDGLVEQRGASIDEGIDRVAGVLAAHAELAAAELADAVLRDATGMGDLDDDVALLVVRFTERSGWEWPRAYRETVAGEEPPTRWSSPITARPRPKPCRARSSAKE